MSIVIKSDSKKWPGSVTIVEQLTLPQAELIDDGNAAQYANPRGGRVSFTAIDKARFPALLACVEKWDLQNISTPPTLDTWPWHSRIENHALINKIWSALLDVYHGEEEVPNESRPTLTGTQAKASTHRK